MTPFAWMAAVFVALVWLFLVIGVQLGEEHALASDSLFWAATVLSVFAIVCLSAHLLVAVIL